jgi:hypothetical protein
VGGQGSVLKEGEVQKRRERLNFLFKFPFYKVLIHIPCQKKQKTGNYLILIEKI